MAPVANYAAVEEARPASPSPARGMTVPDRAWPRRTAAASVAIVAALAIGALAAHTTGATVSWEKGVYADGAIEANEGTAPPLRDALRNAAAAAGDIAPGPGPVPSGSATTPPPSSMMAPEKSVAAKQESADATDLNRHQWGVKSTSGNYPWDTTPSPLGGRMKAAAQKLAGEIAPGPGPVPSGSATTPPPSLLMEPNSEKKDADLNRHQWGVKSTSGNYPWDTTPSPLGGRMKKSA